MSLAWIEYEEQFGKLWHRLVGHQPSYRHYPQAAVELAAIKAPLATFFRAMGGDAAAEIDAVLERSSSHRLTRLQRIVMSEERLACATFTGNSLLLPERMDLFSDPALNRDLYWWLAAFMAQLRDPEPEPGFLGDIRRLARIQQAQERTLDRFPGLCERFDRLAQASWLARPRRSLNAQEAAIEMVIDHLHRRQNVAGLLQALSRQAPKPSYRPFLPSPIWGRSEAAWYATDDEDSSDALNGPDPQRRQAAEKKHFVEQRDFDNSERPDPLTMIVKGEWMLLADQMGDINRPDDDSDPDFAKKAADDFETIQLGRRSRSTSSRISLALETGHREMQTHAARSGTFRYPEWNDRKRRYMPDYCRIMVEPVQPSGDDWCPDEAARRRIRLVRRQFEVLRPKRLTLRQQIDGNELDIDALVRRNTDLASGTNGSDRIYTASHAVARDLAVAVLMDASLSTDSYIENRRVLDVEKEALMALAFGIDACGDHFAIHSFTSRRRHDVRIGLIKAFEEGFTTEVRQRIVALSPGNYTRMGAALRHQTAILKDRGESHRLILLVSDGKPNDSDHYEGRYAIEDTRKAVIEARLAGIRSFAVTVDRRAESYVPYIFGRGGYAMVSHIGQLPNALPRLYKEITSS